MTLFEKWKKGFDAWESRAASLSNKVLESPLALEPAGVLLTALMRRKAQTDRALASVWSAVGLPNRRDQERTLRLLTVLERRVIDLEEKLVDANEALRNAQVSKTPTPTESTRLPTPAESTRLPTAAEGTQAESKRQSTKVR